MVQLSPFLGGQTGEDLIGEATQDLWQDIPQGLPPLREGHPHKAAIAGIPLSLDEPRRLHALDRAHDRRSLDPDAPGQVARGQAVLTPQVLQDELLPRMNPVRSQAPLEVRLNTPQDAGE